MEVAYEPKVAPMKRPFLPLKFLESKVDKIFSLKLFRVFIAMVTILSQKEQIA